MRIYINTCKAKQKTKNRREFVVLTAKNRIGFSHLRDTKRAENNLQFARVEIKWVMSHKQLSQRRMRFRNEPYNYFLCHVGWVEILKKNKMSHFVPFLVPRHHPISWAKKFLCLPFLLGPPLAIILFPHAWHKKWGRRRRRFRNEPYSNLIPLVRLWG